MLQRCTIGGKREITHRGKGEIKTPGVQIPINKEVYEPILKELENYGLKFTEKEAPYMGYNPNNVHK